MAVMHVFWMLQKHFLKRKRNLFLQFKAFLCWQEVIKRTEILIVDNKSSLLELLQKVPCYAIALDELYNISDEEQMSIFMRFLDIESKTRGEDLFKTFDDFMAKSNLSYDKMVSLSTDRSPALIGNEKGLVKRIKGKNAVLLSYHCIIHQAAIFAKPSVALKEVMGRLIKLINFIRSRSAHRQFKQFLSECDSAHSDIVQYNNGCWLRKGELIKHFWQIKEEVISFLENLDSQEAGNYLEFLENEHSTLAAAFLKDIIKHLNVLTTKLQGNGKLICYQIQSVSPFHCKLDTLETDISSQDFFSLPTIFGYKNNSEIILQQDS
ncbi:uncharacterized protein LOC126176492 [Schistocerca cancellata]|uniref:uncharacterized protein LOC126176492 n=1 Tax=Schistocerca cancellata TaxID=274614 RepID=UPI0021193581|nr:uncharacterized protein LOC126176492 [Schistocerca cancellata]